MRERFNSLNQAKEWVYRTSLELDSHNLSDEALRLRKEFEELMQKYAPEFKYQDLDKHENQTKDTILQQQESLIRKELNHTTKKEKIYRKYLKINPNYIGIQDLIKPELRLNIFLIMVMNINIALNVMNG